MGLNKERIRLWVDALRSGKYKQTEGKLSNGEGYCCLGVACEVALQNGLDIKRCFNTKDGGCFVSYDAEYLVLPGIVRNWFGLEHRCPEVIDTRCYYYNDFEDDYRQAVELTELNDSCISFEKIADLIEDNYLADEQPKL